jgi:hypothetical protein
MLGEQWFRLVIRPARSHRKTEAEQKNIFPAQGEPPPQPAKLILPDGTEYCGHVTAGQNNKRFHRAGNRLSLTFEIH